MNQKNYDLLNDLFGWICFSIAATTYLMTVEPSISFWDCPEYVTCATKGEVGHPPGNTFFLLAGRFIANFAGSDISQYAIWINRMSALFSAGTILLLFWTITSLTHRLIVKDKVTLSLHQAITIYGCGIVGALAYTWSDTFWFSAVEAEVYAFSSFMTALTFWLILKWEKRADQPSADKYLLLIAYIVGLSIGVHLLNLLCLPAIVLIYYFRSRRQTTAWGIVTILGLSFTLIAIILYGVIPGIVWLSKGVELCMVNSLGLPYNTGTLTCFLTILASLIFIYIRICRGSRTLGINPRLVANVVFSLLMILIGYSTFAQILIRSSSGLPMNENTPDNIFALSSYLKREQYGDKPLVYGKTFASSALKDKYDGHGPNLYAKCVKNSEEEPDHYYVYDQQADYTYNYETLFPRMYSNTPEHISAYKQWSNFSGQKVSVKNVYDKSQTITVPTWQENMTFFFRYQINYMYWRYFFWNFCGRQNDLRGNGEADRGNWITGFRWIDQWLVGNQDEMPDCITQNKGHNVFYMLPLLLGLIGIFWQWKQGLSGRQGVLTILLLFLMTGIAIVVYLNQTPLQPRERDYAYAGSFYAFAIWIGMGVAGLSALLNKVIKQSSVCSALTIGLAIAVPTQMVGQTWDDHDRSDRYLAHDFGHNYLASLDPNGIIFTNGDNDTFPLWYSIEVEGYRTDTRACNLNYLQTDWYIDQMKSPAYDSKPLPIPYTRQEYAGNNLLFSPVTKSSIQIPGDSIQPTLNIDLKDKRYLYRNELIELAMVDKIARDGWNRPIYYAISTNPSDYAMFRPYLRLVGLAYQVIPCTNGGPESIDIDRTYDCLMNRFKWGNANLPGIYLDETTLNMCLTHRMIFARLTDALVETGDKGRAIKVAEKCLEVLPSYNIPHDISSLSIARCLSTYDKEDEARKIYEELLTQADRYLHWAFTLDRQRQISCIRSISRNLYLMQLTLMEVNEQADTFLLNLYSNKFKDYYEQYKKIG